MVGISNVSLAEAHFTGTFSGPIGERPHHRALRHWSWSSDECEHELRDADGALSARIESNAGRYRLTYPRAWPALSWPTFAEAKRRAESLALAATPSNLSALQMGRRQTRAVDRRGFSQGAKIDDWKA